MNPRRAAYGTWTSPITAQSLARGSVRLSEPELAAGALWWIEGRPAEAGRQVLVRSALDGSGRADAVSAGFSVRTRVHEYGGGAYLVLGDGALLASNDADGRVYRVADGVAPDAITPEPSTPRGLRYADFARAPNGQIVCVRESHEGDGEPVNEIVALADGEAHVIATGHDFYAAPRVSPDGSRLTWICWDHPHMPWDGSELWTAGPDGSGAERVAGGPAEAIVQPGWSPDGALHWASDASGWWNLYREGKRLHAAEAEFAAPLWVFGQATYAFLDDGRIACTWTREGFTHLGLLGADGRLEELDVSHTPVFRSARIRTDGERIAYVGASPTEAPAVVVVDTQSTQVVVAARSTSEALDAGYLSAPEAIDYPSADRSAHALHYPPRNRDFEGPDEEQPPLIVLSHGGPTAQAEPVLDLEVQFWTSRGFGVVDVNYGGSTGYGRAYRGLLRDRWGIVDLQDCTEAALYLARTGRADPKRLAIRGGSAGGYTTLCALTFTDVFAAGASYYGIADVATLFADTHKFESRYGDALIPPHEMATRSPINHVEQISAAVIVFQGLDDPVVPPAQAELIVAALAKRGIEHEYHAYEGESHGFRKAETIAAALEAELAFYGRVLGFAPA